MSGEGRGDVWVQREHPAQDKPQGCSRRQRDGNGGQFSSQISSSSFGWVVRCIFSCNGILSTCQSHIRALTCYLHRNPIHPAHLKHHGATSVFDVLLAQDSPHQEPRALSKQMRSIDEKEKNFELLEADLGTGPGPVSSISGPKVIQIYLQAQYVYLYFYLCICICVNFKKSI